MKYGVFYRDYLPLIYKMKHIKSIEQMKEYIDNISFKELKKLKICNKEKDFESTKKCLKSELSKYYNDVEFLLEGRLLTLDKNDIIFCISDDWNHVYKENILFNLNNIFIDNYLQYLIKNNNFEIYKYDNLIFYKPKETIKLRAIDNMLSIPKSRKYNLKNNEVVEISYTKEYIEELFKRAVAV
jgi:hypothetical protein